MNKEMNQMTKQIIIAVVIIIVAFVGYNMFFVSDDPTDTALVQDGSSTSEFVDGQMILALLNKLGRVTLDDSIFSDKVFMSLESFKRPLEEQVIKRKNPFLPIGVDNSSVILSTTTRSR
jgi:hypothetical protein